MADLPVKNLSVEEIEPRLSELVFLYQKHKARKTKEEVYELWEKSIAPDVPQITSKQWINYTRTLNEREAEAAIAKKQNGFMEEIEARRDVSLVQIEEQTRSVTKDLMDEAQEIMRLHKDEGMPLKERYFALTAVLGVWGKVQKEKEISIKAHAEKRESVGMFAKLLRGAMSGEFTMRDVELMKTEAAAPVKMAEATTE